MAKEFKLPEVGEGISSGTVVSILVATGDRIEIDQPVLELETDKAVVEVPSSVAGVVKEIKVKENEEAQIGQVVLTVDEAAGAEDDTGAEAEKLEAEDQEPEADEAKEKEESQESGVRSQEPAAKAEEAEEKQEARSKKEEEQGAGNRGQGSEEPKAEVRSAESSDGKLLPAAPSVRRLAREKGVDLHQVSGSGILGRISAEDVLRYAKGGATAQPAAAAVPAVQLPDFSKFGQVSREPMSGIRKATVKSMSTAWTTVPMVTHFDKADITEFEELRKKYQPKAEAMGAKLTPTAMLIKVVAGALRKFPNFNASVDVENQEIVYKHYVNIGVAVDTERGLLVPVIKDADQKNMLELAAELGELAEKARDRKLGPEEMQGGNFSVSNLGGIGGTGFTPIVNPPDVAILGVSRGGYEPVYNRDTGEFEPRMMMPLAVTYDHRLIDGAAAARFLRWICQAIEDPFLMALEG